ncbi:putative ribonuclease H protein [Vitis vinifera]|uniref:Putative ribonuclease H protein n=1 Tax=Vitis vinifera TaxID=29760 RepID=A0A438C8I4_VITVI|nr:putative ribonuclease H protein [Vitis vinifera]
MGQESGVSKTVVKGPSHRASHAAKGKAKPTRRSKPRKPVTAERSPTGSDSLSVEEVAEVGSLLFQGGSEEGMTPTEEIEEQRNTPRVPFMSKEKEKMRNNAIGEDGEGVKGFPSLPLRYPFSGVAPPYQSPFDPDLSISAFHSQFPMKNRVLTENCLKKSDVGDHRLGSPHGALFWAQTKRRVVKDFLRLQNPDVVMFQETKREVCDRRFVGSVWSVRNKEWAILPACGASGGILIIWDSKKMRGEEVVIGSFSVSVKFLLDGSGPLWLSAVYGPNNPSIRKEFWEKIRKTGGSGVTSSMRDFDGFIRESELHDPPLRNASFTWSNMQESPVCKRLDRFLYSNEWELSFPQSLQEVLPRWTSDHWPIVLDTNPFKWGPTPFRFENMWLQHHNFKESFSSWWREFEGNGWEGKEKNHLDEIANIDAIEQEGALSSDLAAQRVIRKGELEELILREEIHWKQKAKIKWVKEGIVTQSCFIKWLMGDVTRTSSNSWRMKEESWRVEGIDWSPISEESASRLDSPFAEAEIFNAIFQLDRDKAPGPDGFTIAVFQDCWDVIKEDLVRVASKRSLQETIHSTQGAFVQGRQILDAVLIANEIVDEKKRSGEEGVVFKIDFEKAYDHVKWDFLDHVLEKKGWVKAARGLRQGDPLSPFLFTIVADVLSRMLLKAEERNLLEGFRVSVVLDCKASDWPILYLGLPLGGNPTACGFWDPVIERISRRLDGWQKAYLSFGGRITLLHSCLSHIPSYFLSLFKIPASVAAKIERMQRDFLWSGVGEGKRDHLVRWEAVCKPRVIGGLGIGKIPLRNRALLGKWLWRFPRESTSLWHQVILSIYGTHSNGWDANTIVRWSHRCPWKAIAQGFQDFSKYTRFIVGDGERIRFWEDLWWGDQTLKDQYPRLFRVVMDKNIPISSILGSSRPFSWNFNFRRNLTDSEIEDLERLMHSLDCMNLSTSASDTRSWSLCSSGLFTVKSFFTALSQMPDSSPFFPTKFVWKSQVPFKVKAFIWLVAHKKVNTNDLLQLRRPHKAISPDICKLCMEQGESADHLFLHCSVTLGLWHRLFQLAKMDWVPPKSISDMMFINYKGFGKSKRGVILWQNASIALIWVVWRERNARIFEDKARNSGNLWDSIHFLASFWAFCSAGFKGTPLNVLQLDWLSVCSSNSSNGTASVCLFFHVV